MSVGTPPAKRARRYVWWGLGAIGIAVVLAIAWVGIRGLMAKSELESLAGLSGDLRSALAEQDLAAALPLIDEVGAHAARATSLTNDPIWGVAEFVPVLGPNLEAARVTASQVDAVMRESVPPVVAALTTLEGGFGDDGTIDVSGLSAQAPALNVAVTTLDDAATALGTLDQAQLITQLSSGVGQLSDAIDLVRPAADALARASVVLPTLLGTDEPAHILVMAQNNAELRTGGGITGTFIELAVEQGRVQIVTQADSSEFSTGATPGSLLPESTTALYGAAATNWVQNASMTPEFDVTAAIAQSRWQELTGRTPSVVVSVDPVVLGGLLRVVGPVQVDGAELNNDNLVQRVLVKPYAQLDQRAQTALFQESVAAVVERLSAGAFDPMTLVKQLVSPIQGGHISVWSADPTVQTAIDGTDLAGPAARHASAGSNAFAVYLNDATGGKMDVFLDVAINAGQLVCHADGRREIVVTVDLASMAPANAASLPFSVTGGGHWGVAPGNISTQITVAAPPGAFFGGVQIDGAAVPSGDVLDAGFPSSTTSVTLQPGESGSAQFRFTLTDGPSPDPVILHTPLLTQPEVTILPNGCK